MQDSGVNQRSAMENADWHRIEKLRFADEMADRLYKAAHAGRYDRLFIVAPPRVLGELRDKLHKEVEKRLAGTLDKELTNHTVADIQKLLTGG
jgi:protein required for attachment to host cells